jgi:hypothetical protein
MHFHSPWALLLLLVIPAALLARRLRYRTGAIRFSTTAHAVRSGKSMRQRLFWVPLALRMLSLVFFYCKPAHTHHGPGGMPGVQKTQSN